MNPLALLGAVGVGLSLGLTGSGGSILTVPVLVYLAGVPPREAVRLSLLIVGISALTGAWQRAGAGEVHFKAGGMFVISGMIGAVLGSRLTHLLSPSALMVTFAVLMIVVALRMMLPAGSAVSQEPRCRAPQCLGAGFGVGVLTGFLGVGGGFLLMPALARTARLPLRVASGTSLAVIACNSAAGFLSHPGNAPTRWSLAVLFSAAAAVGVLAGGKMASRLPEKRLRVVFSLLVLATAGWVLWNS